MDEYICYSMSYIEEANTVRICEFDADCMPSHAAISEMDYCVSHSKENIFHIAETMFSGKMIEFIKMDE